MNKIKKLNEQIQKLLEISDETKKSYLHKRQAQADKAQKNLEKAKKSIAKSDQRQISNLPQQTTLENAKAALNALKSEMRKVSSGSDWSLQEEDDGKYLNLSVRYWGQWNDRDEDDDWAPLDDKYKQILDDILVKVQKQHGVQIINQGSEKKWLSFDVLLKDNKTQTHGWQLHTHNPNLQGKLVSLSYFIGEPIDDGVDIVLRKDGIIDIDCFGETASYFAIPDMKSLYDFIHWANPTKDPHDIPEIPQHLLNEFNRYKNLIDSKSKLKDESLNITEAGKDYKHAKELGYSTAQDFNVGDKVQMIWSKRIGTIVKQIAVDVYEVEFPEVGSLMARTDRYYANDLKLI